MEDWKLRDTLGVLIVLGVTLSAAGTLEGIAQALVMLVGVVIALLWIGNFFLEGYTDTIKTEILIPETESHIPKRSNIRFA